MLQRAYLEKLFGSGAFPDDLKLFIYDADDCLAEKSNDDITVSWDVALSTKFNLTFEEAKAKRIEYFETEGCSLTGFAKAYGLPMSWVDEVYAETGDASGKRFVARHTPSPRMAELFGIFHRWGIRQALVTQGHPNHYGQILHHIGLHDYVAEEHRIDRTKPPYEKKENEVWKNILAQHGVLPHQAIVLEDTPRNCAQAAANGIYSMLIGNRDPGPHAAGIHWRFATPEDGLEALYRHLAPLHPEA